MCTWKGSLLFFQVRCRPKHGEVPHGHPHPLSILPKPAITSSRPSREILPSAARPMRHNFTWCSYCIDFYCHCLRPWQGIFVDLEKLIFNLPAGILISPTFEDSATSDRRSSSLTNGVEVHLFSNAQNLSIRDTAIHNTGRDMIINNYIYPKHEPVCACFPYVAFLDDLGGLSQSPSNIVSQWPNLCLVTIMRDCTRFGYWCIFMKCM